MNSQLSESTLVVEHSEFFCLYVYDRGKSNPGDWCTQRRVVVPVGFFSGKQSGIEEGWQDQSGSVWPEGRTEWVHLR